MKRTKVLMIKTKEGMFLSLPCGDSCEQESWFTLICNNKHCGFQNLWGLFMWFFPGFLSSSKSTCLLQIRNLLCSMQEEWLAALSAESLPQALKRLQKSWNSTDHNAALCQLLHSSS